MQIILIYTLHFCCFEHLFKTLFLTNFAYQGAWMNSYLLAINENFQHVLCSHFLILTNETRGK